MDLKKYLKDRRINIKQMSAITNIPYTTLSDIVNNKVNIEECKYKTLKAIANFVNVSVDDLVYEKEDFQTFRNKLHHYLAVNDDLDVIVEILTSKKIDYYLFHDDALKALYLVSLLDYLSNKNDIPLCKDYSEIRGKKLKEPYHVGDSKSWLSDSKFIPEFLLHNIYEGELFDAV